jgi:hypothetical protein
VETLTYSSGRASGCDSPGLLNFGANQFRNPSSARTDDCKKNGSERHGCLKDARKRVRRLIKKLNDAEQLQSLVLFTETPRRGKRFGFLALDVACTA